MRVRGAAAAVMLAALVSSGVALGGIPSGVTALKLSNRPPAFHGRVVSPLTECKPDRRVKLFRKHHGSTLLVGRTDSEADGIWLIDASPPKRGVYYAKVKQHIVDVGGTTVLCEADFSGKVIVD